MMQQTALMTKKLMDKMARDKGFIGDEEEEEVTPRFE